MHRARAYCKRVENEDQFRVRKYRKLVMHGGKELIVGSGAHTMFARASDPPSGPSSEISASLAVR